MNLSTWKKKKGRRRVRKEVFREAFLISRRGRDGGRLQRGFEVFNKKGIKNMHI